MNTKSVIYLDYNATTPCDPRVVEAMLPYFTDKFGNASSSTHRYGWQASEAVSIAREQVAALIGSEPDEIIFTSGATESCNLALKGAYEIYGRKGNHIITLNTEHSAVLDCCKWLERQGAEVTYLSPGTSGIPEPELIASAIRPDTCMVAVMWANNETGVISNIEAIADVCAAHGVVFFSDGTQGVGKLPIEIASTNIHLMAGSAHKFYGPKGAGFLYVRNDRPRIKLAEQIHGGGHERDIRSGTLNVPAIVGLGKAAAIAATEMASDAKRLQILRHRLETELIEMDAVRINGDVDCRLSHVSNLAIRYVQGKQLMTRCSDTFAVAAGSACTSAEMRPSHVLRGMGFSDERGHSSIRISLGKYTTKSEIDLAIKSMKRAINALRSESPVWQMVERGIDLGLEEW